MCGNEVKMNVRKIDVNEFQKRKLERSYISLYIVIKSIIIETPDGIEPKNLTFLCKMDMESSF